VSKIWTRDKISVQGRGKFEEGGRKNRKHHRRKSGHFWLKWNGELWILSGD